MDLDAAKAWANDEVAGAGLTRPTELYHKGAFNGVLFARFAAEDGREKFVQAARVGHWAVDGNKVRARADQPLDARAVGLFLFGLNKQLVEWGVLAESLGSGSAVAAVRPVGKR